MFVGKQMVVARRAVRDQRPSDGARKTPRCQNRACHHQARNADARIVRVDRINELGNAIGIESHIGQQPAIRHGKERRFILGFRRDDIDIVLIFGNPVFVMRKEHMTIRRALFIDCETRAACQMECIHRDRFHGIQDHYIVKCDIRTFGNALHFIYILWIALLGKWQILARLDLAPFQVSSSVS